MNALVNSINGLHLKGIASLSTTGSESEEANENRLSEQESNDGEIFNSGLRDVTVKLHGLMKQLQELQSVASRPKPPRNRLTTSEINPNQSKEISLFPVTGWVNSHLRDRYLGITAEYSWSGCRLTWSIDIVIESKDETVTPMTTAGYMRWKLLNAVPFKKDFNIARMTTYVTKIDEAWEADEVFTGTLDLANGSFNTLTHSTRAVPGNPADVNNFIGKGLYSFTLCYDGRDLIGRNIRAEDESVSKDEFLTCCVTRCTAY